ncbi:AMP-binding protein [Corynebacterium ulceribovis]|uniref:AMP-binding protein n=1 Tax=Corynebacterium ulceribovis TaxID=487732 RepID=UPI0003826B62|nr:AMP-binding protein [Corynebacterium ulceribovis]
MPVQSPHAPIEIPNLSLYDYLFADMDEAKLDRVAMVDSIDGREFTYRQLRQKIDAFAGALADMGIKPGDVVGLHMPNSLAFVISFHGIMRAGATVTTLNVMYTPEEITKQLIDANAVALVTMNIIGHSGIYGAAQAKIPSWRVIVADGPQGLLPLTEKDLPAPDISFDPATHLAVIPYSSGTSGKPKGVKLTHKNLVANVAQIQVLDDGLGLTENDTVMAILPFFHIYGMTAIVNNAIKRGFKFISMPRFDLEQYLALHEQYDITYSFVAPPVMVALAKHPMVDQYDLSSLRGVFSGAAALDERLAQAVADRLGVEVNQGYGMTETSPLAHARPNMSTPLGSIGPVAVNTEYMNVDVETLEEIPVPTEGRSPAGELWLRGPQVMVGYLNNDEATKEALTDEGWLRTGDMIEVDADGNVYVVDRLKELIKYKGYQVPPAELEAVLLSHPDIADAAAVGVIREGEEIPKAYVVLQSGKDITPQQIMRFVGERVAPYKRVREVEFVAEVPKSGTGKILRKDLRARDAAEQAEKAL